VVLAVGEETPSGETRIGRGLGARHPAGAETRGARSGRPRSRPAGRRRAGADRTPGAPGAEAQKCDKKPRRATPHRGESIRATGNDGPLLVAAGIVETWQPRPAVAVRAVG